MILDKEIIILYGIAGSGKSYYANEYLNQEKLSIQNSKLTYSEIRNHSSRIIDLDDRFRRGWKSYSIENKIEELSLEIFNYTPYNSGSIILDGLITTNNQVIDMVTAIKARLHNSNWKDAKYKIVWWKEDRESCLFNDLKRRGLSSKLTIENIPFEEPDLSLLSILGFSRDDLISKEVVRKPLINKLIVDAGIDEGLIKNGKILRSESWSLGGTSGDCYGNSHTHDADHPLNFKEFDTLIGSICPDIPYILCKKIIEQCCSIEEEGESDYYGGSISRAFHVCDLQKLEFILRSKNFIK